MTRFIYKKFYYPVIGKKYIWRNGVHESELCQECLMSVYGIIKEEKATQRLKRWIEHMKKQGANPATLTSRQYALHLMLMGGMRLS
ncbi:MAG: hypothetical protein HF962_00555 [Sulfurovum sp.]|nr:hypothetical protein [Sulfurovum sp.]